MNYEFDRRNPKIDHIINLVCDSSYVTREEILSKSRKRDLVMVRQILMVILKEFTEASLKTIGQHLGGRDHSTVIHGLETMDGLMVTDRVLKYRVEDLKNTVVQFLYNKNEPSKFTDDEFYSELLYLSNWERWDMKTETNHESIEE